MAVAAGAISKVDGAGIAALEENDSRLLTSARSEVMEGLSLMRGHAFGEPLQVFRAEGPEDVIYGGHGRKIFSWFR